DLVGSTALSGQLDPEELSDVTREYHSVCAEVIERHAGRIAQFLGDGLLVYFGYPLSHEDDAQRAVRAGLDIVAAIASERERLGKPLQVHIAVHTGLVVVGQLGGETNPDPMAISGETPNIAARLQSIAEPGQVVISAATYRLIQGFFVCRSLGTPALKGVVAPIEAFEVVEPTGIHTRFERAVALGLTPFVSRKKEVEHLLDRWQEARNGSGQVVMISGEAGIGKSRLVQMLKERTADEPGSDFGCRCSPYYQNSALYPANEFLQRMLRFNCEDNAETKLAKLEKALAQFGFSLPEVVPLFATLLSLPANDRYPALLLTPQRQKQKTFEAIIEWLMRHAERASTRLIVEDLHWADPSTLELIELLIEPASAARLMLILVFRPEFVPVWPVRPHITNLSLSRLAPAATRLMIQSVTGGKQLPTEVVNEIVAKTDGVPLFVEDLTQMVLESGLVQEQGGRYVLTSALPSLAIPSTLYDSLMARLDQLGTAKGVAQLAATIGKEFSYELLRAVSPLEETRLTGALNRLVDAELLGQNLEQNRLRYSFRHALIRDAAYDSLLRSQRRQYHRKVGEVLRDHFPDLIAAQPELLANHLTEAGLIEEAIPCWQRAGQQALERSANKEAVQHLTKALHLFDTLIETPARLQQQLLLLTTLGTALIATTGFSSDEVEKIYARARKLSRHAGEAPQFFRVLFGMCLSHASRGEYRTALELAEQCLRIAEDATDTSLLLEAHHALGIGLVCVGELLAGIEHLEQAVAMYDPRQHGNHAQIYGHDPAVVCLMHASWAYWLLGFPDRALKLGEESLARAREIAHPSTSATTAAFVACLQQWCGNASAVEELCATAIAISAEHDFAYYRAMALTLDGWALVQRDQRAEGIGQMCRGLEAFRAMGGILLSSYFAGLLAEVYAMTGRVEEGIRILDGVDNDLEPWWEAELYRVRGEMLLRQGEFQSIQDRMQNEAIEYFDKALTIARARKAKSLELRATTSLSRIWLQQGKRLEAMRLLQGILASFTEGFGTADLRRAEMLLNELSPEILLA
ncbi:MAG: AAA family ATPase, partial [Deltaproteobacteria bacterium]|nr:AAA family ATPase [Deltaproteobacteria bacterium]